MPIPGKLYKIINENLYFTTIEDYTSSDGDYPNGHYPNENDILMFLYVREYNEYYKSYHCVDKTNKIVYFVSNNKLISVDIEELC